MSVVNQEEFAVLTGFAKAFAVHQGEDALHPRHFAAAAWLACSKGLLKTAPTLEAHIKAHGDAVSKLLKAENIHDVESADEPVAADIKLALDDSLKRVIDRANAKDESLIEFVDQLFKGGLQLQRLESVAYHEAGHAVVSLVLRPEVRLKQATIEKEGNAAGSVSFIDSEAVNPNQEYFLENICIAIAGQVAQMRKFGVDSADAGALSDLSRATLMAWDYITRFGLDPQFGPVILETLKERGVTSGWLFDEAQRRLQAVLKDAQAKTVEIVELHWDKVERVAQLLLERKAISEEELRQVINL